MRKGPGIYIWADKSKYEGEFKNGLRSGIGEMKYSNGDIYNGNWSKDKA
jgi:hypothetical protein